jgi:hypothetical protein
LSSFDSITGAASSTAAAASVVPLPQGQISGFSERRMTGLISVQKLDGQL